MTTAPATRAPAMLWTPAMETGIPEMDEQHRRLVDLVNGFYAALVQRDAPRDALRDLLRGMTDYTVYHFKTEERLMVEAAFPNILKHVGDHDAFVSRVSDMAVRFSTGQLVLSLEATQFLREWLTGHIMGTDKTLAAYLKGSKARGA